MRGPSITILGSFGGFNAGDDAILYSVSAALRREIPDSAIRAVSSDPGRYRSDLEPLGVSVVGKSPTSRTDVPGPLEGAPLLAPLYRMRFGPRYFGPGPLAAVLRSDTVVLCGGVFHDHRLGEKRFNIMAQWSGVLDLAARLGVMVVPFNTGMGPLSTEEGRRMAARILSRSPFVSLREPEGAAVLEEAGVEAPVYCGADPALLDEPAGGERAREILGRAGIPRNARLIGVNLCSYLDRWTDTGGSVSPEDLVRSVSEAVSAVVDAQPVVFCTNCADEDLSARLAAALGDRTPLLTGLDHHELLSAAGSLEMMLGMRLHACVFAAAAGVPAMGLDYAPKVRSFLRLAGLGEEAVPVDRKGLAGLPGLLSSAWARRDELRARVRERLPGLRERAGFPAVMIGRLLRGEEPGGGEWFS